MNHSSDDGINVVKPKRSRAGKKNAQGTSPKVRMERLRTQIRQLTNDIAVLQAKYDVAVRQGAVVLAERDSARDELKAAENASSRRLLPIENEVPDFARVIDDGTVGCYAADFIPATPGWQGGPPWQRGSSSVANPGWRQTGDPLLPWRRESP